MIRVNEGGRVAEAVNTGKVGLVGRDREEGRKRKAAVDLGG